MSLKINMPEVHYLTKDWASFSETFCIFKGDLCIHIDGYLYNIDSSDCGVVDISEDEEVELIDIDITVKRRTNDFTNPV